MPIIVPQDVYEVLEKAVSPSTADVIAAKSAVLTQLRKGGSIRTNDLVEAVLRDLGAPTRSFRPQHLVISPEADAAQKIDRGAAPIQLPRLEQAIKQALAELAAEASSYLPTQDHWLYKSRGLGIAAASSFRRPSRILPSLTASRDVLR